jgi:hypothetical protein
MCQHSFRCLKVLMASHSTGLDALAVCLLPTPRTIASGQPKYYSVQTSQLAFPESFAILFGRVQSLLACLSLHILPLCLAKFAHCLHILPFHSSKIPLPAGVHCHLHLFR